jgi:hypothetical protein
MQMSGISMVALSGWVLPLLLGKSGVVELTGIEL